MSEWKYLYNTAKWQRARKQFLFDNPRCVMCLAMNKQTPAKEVDHIISHKGDELLFWDDANYQALCKPCHSRKTWMENKGIRLSGNLPKSLKPKSKDITLLFGAPCSGKTTWANKQDAVVVDLNEIKNNVSGQDPYDMDDKYLQTSYEVQNRMIKETTGRMIVIASLPDSNARSKWVKQLNAKPFMMITPEHECIRRLKASDRPNKPAQIAFIKRWFDEFTPLGNESFVK